MTEQLTDLDLRILKRVHAGYLLGDKLLFTALSLETRGFLRFKTRPWPRYTLTDAGRKALGK